MAESQAEGISETSSKCSDQGGGIHGNFNLKVQWAIPHRIDQMAFIGKDILAVAHDIYIIFYDFKKNSEMVYMANTKQKGDGVDVIAGHRSNLFAFAEKVQNARIFLMTYPHFNILAELKDTDVNRYKGLCMMECDLIAGFSGFPNYLITVWSWRSNQRLLSIPTGVVKRSLIFTASRTHMLLAECWGEGLIVWKVAQCYHKCLMMKRVKEEVVGWEASDALLVGICWSNEGHLYAIDPSANIYCLQSDGIGMKAHKEWGEDSHRGKDKPLICAFGNGLLVYGPDKYLRALKKTEQKWNVVFTFTPNDGIERLVANVTCDVAAMWTKDGLVYKVSGESEDKIEVTPMVYKQRNIKKIHLLAPEFKYLVTVSESSVLCFYEVETGKLVLVNQVDGEDVSFEMSPVDPIIVVYGCIDEKYGMSLYMLTPELKLERVARVALTYQTVTRVVFSETGRELVAAAMAAGHLFIYKLSTEYQLTLVRYAEVGRGLADCMLMKVGAEMRCFSIVLFSDKYLMGERVVCINADTGKDNKFAGKMMGPYSRLLPLKTPDTMVAIPHLSRNLHVLKLQGDKGVTVQVKMGPIFYSGHDIKQITGFYNGAALLTCGYGGILVLRRPDADAMEQFELRVKVTHRYEYGIKRAVVDQQLRNIAHLGGNRTCAVLALRAPKGSAGVGRAGPAREPLDLSLLDKGNFITVIERSDKTYLELQEEKKVREEAMDYKKQKDDVVNNFLVLQEKVVELLEENIEAMPLHQLSLSEFNLHLEHRKERKQQAEREREEIRLNTEALIRAQDKVTLWIKTHCWDSMLTPRVKLFAIFSHYQVENFPVLPTQRDKWPELSQAEALRLIEIENDHDLFKPWLEQPPEPSSAERLQTLARGSASAARVKEEGAHDPESRRVTEVNLTSAGLAADAEEAEEAGQPHVLAGSNAHHYVTTPPYKVPQTLAFSYLQMNWVQHIVKLTVQKMRVWFNKQFDDLVVLKKREVGLVEERNARLRFIIEELNKLSDLRGSFHHLTIEIKDPLWRQEEQPHRLIKVDPEECEIAPYISPSQVVVPPPEPVPKDDFKERALMDMMDGVLEKLWHEEIKKPIPLPLCMLDKDPEHFNEDDLRLVFDYEAKVAFRNEERDKYRKMLHAEYAKLSQILNEGIVKFNSKLKEVWLTKLKVDSVIGQENLNLMRLRRTNLDRVEMDEKLDEMRATIARHENEMEELSREVQMIQEQSAECQAAYDALVIKDRYMERTFKNHFVDLSPIIVDQCYKFFKKRPKWQQRATMIPVVLYELASAVASGVRPHLLHTDCVDFFKGVEHLDSISNMPHVMDEGLWATMCKLRRAKIESEIRIRAAAQEMTYVDNAHSVWHKAIQARKHRLALAHEDTARHRDLVERAARNRTIQLVLPAGQVEIITSGHIEDYEDATLILKTDIEAINNLILKVGEMKLRMMRKQMEFRKVILAKEWEHAQMKMKLRHMEQELHSYQRLKIHKELQYYLKNKELGYTEEQEFVRMEKEMEASKFAVNKGLEEQIHRVEDLEVRINGVEAKKASLEKLIASLTVKISEKRLNDDPLHPIRIRRLFKSRMETLVMRSKLIRDVQANHTTIVMLQTQLELLRLKTYPTLASFRTYD